MYHVTDVVHAFAQISSEFPGTQLVIGNDGSQTQSLKRLVQDLGMASRVDFIGRVDEDVLPSLLANARAYVTASEVDGTSVTLLQAMAMRCPVIASDITGNRQWTHGNRALSFPSGDVQGLAQCMADVLTGRTMPDIDAARQAVLAEADWFANIRRLPQIITG